jgi:transposase
VEAGLPRKEAKRIYEHGKSSLDLWMQQYGSPEYHRSKRRQYTNLQKRTIVSAIEQGRMTIKEAQTAYKISRDKVIRDWLLKFNDEKVELCTLNPSDMAINKEEIFHHLMD